MRQPLRRGFTFIEIMVAVAIMSVVASIAIPELLHAMKAAEQAKAIGMVRYIFDAQLRYRSDKGVPASSLSNLSGYLPNAFTGKQAQIGNWLYATSSPRTSPGTIRVAAHPVGAKLEDQQRVSDRMFIVLETGTYEHRHDGSAFGPSHSYNICTGQAHAGNYDAEFGTDPFPPVK